MNNQEMYATTKSETSEMFSQMLAVLSDDLINLLEQLARDGEMLQWTRGDLALLVYEQVKLSDLRNRRRQPYTFMDCCYFISLKFLHGSRSVSTIKANALVAKRFPKMLREKYHYEDMPFSHFVYAAQRKFIVRSAQTGKYLWHDILTYSWEKSQELQWQSISVADLEEHFEHKAKTFEAVGSSYVTGWSVPIPVISNTPPQPRPSDRPEIIRPQPNPFFEFAEAIATLTRVQSAIVVKFPSLSDPLQELLREAELCAIAHKLT